MNNLIIALTEQEVDIILKWAGYIDADQTWMTEDEKEFFKKVSKLKDNFKAAGI